MSGLAAVGGRLVRPPIDDERAGWPIVEVVDRSRDEPWKTSLVTSALIRHLRDHDRTVVCVHNTPGPGARARLPHLPRARALRAVRGRGRARPTTARCRAGAAATTRPAVCLVVRRLGVRQPAARRDRLREELEAAAGRPVVAVTGGDVEPPPAAGVYVGTEAVLHRVPAADVVAFLDIDTELLAPRYRAAEQAMALLVRGARLVGPRGRGGRLLAADVPAPPRGRPGGAARRPRPAGRARAAPAPRCSACRRSAHWPRSAAREPTSVAGALRDAAGDHGRRRRRAHWTVRADTLGGARSAPWLARPRAPKGSRVRIEVDPPRR